MFCMAEERLQRRLAAILSAAGVGYSRLKGMDQARTLSRLNALRRELIDPAMAAQSGRIVKLTGDGASVECASASDAVACAIEIQRQFREHDASGSEANPIQIRIVRRRSGIHHTGNRRPITPPEHRRRRQHTATRPDSPFWGMTRGARSIELIGPGNLPRRTGVAAKLQMTGDADDWL
jgi:hypothetical protein